MNGDTFPDIVTANETSDDISIRLGRGDGTFAADSASRWVSLRTPLR